MTHGRGDHTDVSASNAGASNAGASNAGAGDAGASDADAGGIMIDVDGIPDFWERVRSAPERYLLLDYDGTLAPFRTNRMDALPVPGALEAVKAIRDSGTTRLAMLTGRPVRELVELVGDLGVPMVGSHGFEFMAPGGDVELGELTDEQDERFGRAEREARAVARAARVERKPASVGLHTRGMPEEEARALHEEILRAWSIDLEGLGLECRRFSGGVELRLTAVHKGTALERIIERRSDAAFCVYVGDDDTDEDAFKALPASGVGIKVGPRGVRTSASGRLDDPKAVGRFLETWLTVTR
jgi:trehalose-phosphatase